MNFPEELRYTRDHEWVRVEGDVATIGITEFAQEELGEVVFVDLPEPGKNLTKGSACCVVESTKAASDVYAPISGTVKESNSALESEPSLVNSASYTDGWMVRVESFQQAELDSLMSADEYRKHIGK